AETDWSWNTSIADFDNDGYRDLIVTNGYPRDVTDHDYLTYRQNASAAVSKQDMINQIPQIKLANFAFRNQGDLHFENTTTAWGMDQPSFSNGGIYVDLDGDGDLDYVINNINDEAFLYQNTTNEPGKSATRHYLDIRFHGELKNIEGIGARAEIHYGNHQLQAAENIPYRGYLSTVASGVHFGLGNTDLIDSVVIFWNNRLKQTLYKIPADHVLKVDIRNADHYTIEPPATDTGLFDEVLPEKSISYLHKETDYIDFDQEHLLPHKLSQYGPGLAVGDVDGNGLDDIVIGGNRSQPPACFLQQRDGKMLRKDFPVIYGPDSREPENMGMLLFDADNDGDNDLYLTSGSNEFVKNTKNYQDRFYVNDGKGNFRLDTAAIPRNYVSKSCIKGADFDHDGRIDLFIGGRGIPGNYPLPVSSFIYRNMSVNGQSKFVDVTHEVCPGLENIGLVCDALWTDFDNDGWMDLIVVGEWMSIRFFHNDHGRLKDISSQTGISGETGWWNSITAGDFDNDGDMDYVVGNLGLNSFYRASHQYPIRIYASDFDHNGVLDAIPTLYLPDQDGRLHEYPAQTRDDILLQLPGLRKRFPTYKDFGKADIHDILSKESLDHALRLEANQMASVYIENLGNGRFAMHPLPAQAQFAPVYGMQADDFNGDGYLDLLLCGNDFGTEVNLGRYDALNGLLLLGDGHGNFKPTSVSGGGIYIPGDAKALVKLTGSDNQYLIAASQNRGELKTFRLHKPGIAVRTNPNETAAYLLLKSGKTRKEEIPYGSSFLSQSSRTIWLNSQVRQITLTDNTGNKREITP
ncbi:MAG TPA: FG-GAP-like repeat-containing protein, partial [Puia sp.]|nr:FG-GAP-like repeat-containing protein [Puia sp.]